jgi:D-beta-D-heptose 7-phosphate kinase/D-beta-D-heptose 1-phosphate adenosyltransferase
LWQRLIDLLEKSANPRILVLGDFMIDRYLYGDAERISPEAPVPVLRVVRQEISLGGAGSVAANIAALGANADCAGVVGADADAGLLVKRLSDLGAATDGLLAMADRPTTRKTRLIGLAQHRHRQQLIRMDDEITSPIEGEAAEKLIAYALARLGACRAVCIEDYDKGVVTSQIAGAVIEAARQRNIPTLVDPASIADYRRYAGASVMTPNRSETERVIGRRLPSVAAVRESARAILDACHTEQVCVTLDAEGCALIGPGDEFVHAPTRTREVYDVTGAGDEVLAAMAVAVAAGGSMAEAAALANVAGGLEVEKFGCIPVARDEVIGEILLEHQRQNGKIAGLETLLPLLRRRRARGERIAFTNGCFDLLHIGHVDGFAFAKQHADVLVVGLNSDASVRALDKDDDRPIVPQDDRARVLAALGDVDHVVIFDEPTPQRLIEVIEPDVLVKGQDWEGKVVVGREVVERRGGRVIFAPFIDGRSTTNLIDRIRNGSTQSV